MITQLTNQLFVILLMVIIYGMILYVITKDDFKK